MPQLDQGFEIFANWQTVVFCLGIYLITYAIRTVVENPPSLKTFATGWVWTELLLPLGPIGTGLVLALLAKKFPWPMPLADSMSAKLMYGSICGMASGWVYARARAFFGIAADNGNTFAAKVLKRPSDRPTPLCPPPPPMNVPPNPPPPPPPPPPAAA